MERLASSAPKNGDNTSTAPAKTRSVGRREYDQALSRRLEQIRNAQGYDDPPQAVLPRAAEAPATVAHGRVFGIRALFLTFLVSAIAGASLTWLATPRIEGSRPPASLPAETQRQPTPFTDAVAAAPVTARTAPPPAAAPDAEALALIERWRNAWSRRDVDTYLGCYGTDFTPADGKTPSDWAAARRKNLLSRHDISVQVRALRIMPIDDRQMKVVFLQDYASGSYRESAQEKTLLLRRNGGQWQIAGEWLGSGPSPPSRS